MATECTDLTVLDSHLGDRADPMYWLTEVLSCEGDPSPHTTSKVLDVLKRKALAHRLETLATSDTLSLSAMLDQAREVAIGLSPTNAEPPKELHQAAAAIVEAIVSGAPVVPTISTGFPEIDEQMGGGYADGRLYIIGARPGVGKSAWSMTSALRISKYHPVGFISCEMSGMELTIRALAQLAQINSLNIQSGDLDANQRRRLQEAAKELATRQLFYEDEVTSSLSAALKTIEEMADAGARVIVLDYIQLLSTGHDNRTQDLTTISRELKIITKRKSVALVTPSQLKRWGGKGDPPDPTLEDLRESGSIEQDADFVAFLHKKPVTEFPDENDPAERVTFMIRKNRHGNNGFDELLRFRGAFTEFLSHSDRDEERVANPSYWRSLS